MTDEPLPIMAPDPSFCPRHWAEIEADRTINAVWCLLRVVTRTLEIDAFTSRMPQTADGKLDSSAISRELQAVAPLCCFLGDDEMVLVRAEGRGHMGQRRS